MSFPSRLYTPIDFTGDFQSPAKRIKASNVTIRSASHKNKVFVYLTQAGVEVWFFETDPGVDGEIEEFKKAVDKGDTVAKNYNFVAAMKRRLNRSTNKPAANDSNMQRTASDTDDCRYVFVRIVDTSSLKLRLAMATKLASVRIMASYWDSFNAMYLTFAPPCIDMQFLLYRQTKYRYVPRNYEL